MTEIKQTALEIARDFWGEILLEWVEALAIECAATSQNRGAARLGRSASMVSQILRNKYLADLATIEEWFRGTFLEVRLDCPTLGSIPANECQDWRKKSHTFVIGNLLRVRMYQDCGKCLRNKPEGAA